MPSSPWVLKKFVPSDDFFTYQHGRQYGNYWLERLEPSITCPETNLILYDHQAWYSYWMEIDEETVGLSGVKYEWELIA